MTRLAEVIDAFREPFLKEYGSRLTQDHLRALAAIGNCRSGVSPKLQVHCPHCAHGQLVPHSCGHRHCPQCQHHDSQAWLEKQVQRLVPADYFLLTFTIPAEFRALARGAQKTVYDLLIRVGWQTVQSFARNDRHLQGDAGAIAVLHTHSRQLEYHPHVHFVVPAAAFDTRNRLWRRKQSAKPYLFNHKALAKVFRGKLLAGLAAAGLPLPVCAVKNWVVDCKAVGSGEKALVYLGRYLYRGVIREQDIVDCANGQVTFAYREAKTGRMVRRTVPGSRFLWLVLQHVLPSGFHRARNFGFLHPNCKRLIGLLHLLFRFVPPPVVAKPRPAVKCPCCGADMIVVRTRIRPGLPVLSLPPGSVRAGGC